MIILYVMQLAFTGTFALDAPRTKIAPAKSSIASACTNNSLHYRDIRTSCLAINASAVITIACTPKPKLPIVSEPPTALDV